MLKQYTIGITLNKYHDLNCSEIINKKLEKYLCKNNYNINNCCEYNINNFFNNSYNLNKTNREENFCYQYNNNSYKLDCYESSYKYHIFVYFLLFLFILINLIILIYFICYSINYSKKENIYSEAEKNILIYKSNSLYNGKYNGKYYENNDFDN